MTSAEQEIAILDAIVPRLQAEGYEVFVHPSPQILPPFMERYAPDAIAIKKDRRLAIEVVREGPSSEAKLRTIQSLFADKPDWELRVYWVSKSETATGIEISDLRSVEASIREVEVLADQGSGAPALLLGWATFEAAARSLSPARLSRPQSPLSLIESLASEGLVTPKEADKLRSIGKVRTAVAHGDLRADVDRDQLQELIAITRTMISEAQAAS